MEEEKEQCKTLCQEWNTAAPSEDVQWKYEYVMIMMVLPLTPECMASKKISAEIAQWTECMQHKTGAVFFIFGAYTNTAG